MRKERTFVLSNRNSPGVAIAFRLSESHDVVDLYLVTGIGAPRMAWHHIHSWDEEYGPWDRKDFVKLAETHLVEVVDGGSLC